MLHSKIAYVNNSSKGESKINCSQKLTYNLSGEGNIEVGGNPDTVINEGLSASKGKLIIK